MFENEHYLAIGKQAGWPVQPLARGRSSLVEAVTSFLKHRAHGVEPRLRLGRGLDAASSGVVLFATSEEGDRALATALRGATTVLEAVCAGHVDDDAGELVDFVRKQRVGRRDVLIKVHAGGTKAITHYRVLGRDGARAHLELEPILGPAHHVRAQLALAGLPIVGDPVYGGAEGRAPGMLLHLRRLAFSDPLSSTRLTIEAPTPEGFFGPPPATAAPRYLLFYKPYGVLTQFTTTGPDERCLADYPFPPGVYPVGRLDKDSEGLLLLTSDGAANARLSDPAYAKEKCYWVQVERIPDDAALGRLAAGVVIRGYRTRPCRVRRIDPPALPERDPPIRSRRDIPTCWLEIVLTEGKNRQVRRMTAAVGHPTLRLVRARIDRFSLGSLTPGDIEAVSSF